LNEGVAKEAENPSPATPATLGLENQLKDIPESLVAVVAKPISDTV
jgi:hypothetical protein